MATGRSLRAPKRLRTRCGGELPSNPAASSPPSERAYRASRLARQVRVRGAPETQEPDDQADTADPAPPVRWCALRATGHNVRPIKRTPRFRLCRAAGVPCRPRRAQWPGSSPGTKDPLDLSCPGSAPWRGSGEAATGVAPFNARRPGPRRRRRPSACHQTSTISSEEQHRRQVEQVGHRHRVGLLVDQPVDAAPAPARG